MLSTENPPDIEEHVLIAGAAAALIAAIRAKIGEAAKPNQAPASWLDFTRVSLASGRPIDMVWVLPSGFAIAASQDQIYEPTGAAVSNKCGAKGGGPRCRLGGGCHRKPTDAGSTG